MSDNEPHDDWCQCEACMDREFDRYHDGHGYDCDCEECELQHARDGCGELPAHLGGGCRVAGSEYCDFDCPFRDEVFSRRKKR